MAKVISLIVLFDILFGILSWGSTLQYAVEGENSVRGPYHGWITVEFDGAVKRVVEYRNFRFEDYRVQEAWIGKLNAEGGFEFSTSQAHYIYQVNDFALSPREAFQKESVSLTPGRVNSFIAADHSHSIESISASSVPLAPRFQFITDTRVRIVSSDVPAIIKPAIAIAKMRFNWDSDPRVQELEGRSHCQRDALGVAKARSFEDFTDQMFYLQFKDIVRAYNSPATVLALAEGLYRRAAFGASLQKKVELAAESIDPRFINRWGMSTYAFFEQNSKVRHVHDNDSALWTGQYVAFLGSISAKSKHPKWIERIKKRLTA